ncbi:DNA primase [Desulfarculales bacterium]
MLLLPTGEDPDSFVRTQGPQGLEAAITRARPLTEMVIDQMVHQGDLTSPEGKSAIVQAAGEVVKAIADPVTSTGYLERLAAQLSLPAAAVAVRLGLPLTGLSPLPARQAASPASGPARLVHDSEQALLELALASPLAARVLAQGGALDDVTDAHLKALAQAILAVIERRAEPTPDAVSQALEDQSLARLVSQICQRCPCPADPEAAARSILEQLARRNKHRQRAALTPAIAAAHAEGRPDKVSQYQAQRSLQGTSPPPLSSTGKD